ncbi:hypothetical protein GCM10008903_10930 [Clostridium cadaveris]
MSNSTLIPIKRANNIEKLTLKTLGVAFGKITLAAKKNAVILKKTYIIIFT